LSNKGHSNLAKDDIAQLIMTSGTANSCPVDIFYQIKTQNPNLLYSTSGSTRREVGPGVHMGPHLGKGEGQRWYHSKER